MPITHALRHSAKRFHQPQKCQGTSRCANCVVVRPLTLPTLFGVSVSVIITKSVPLDGAFQTKSLKLNISREIVRLHSLNHFNSFVSYKILKLKNYYSATRNSTAWASFVLLLQS